MSFGWYSNFCLPFLFTSIRRHDKIVGWDPMKENQLMNFASRMGGTWLIKQTKKEPSVVIMGWALVSAYEASRSIFSSWRELFSSWVLELLCFSVSTGQSWLIGSIFIVIVERRTGLASDIGCADRRLATSHLERPIYEYRAFRKDVKKAFLRLLKGLSVEKERERERVYRSCISLRQE